MTTLRAYLLIRRQSGEWDVTIERDLSALRDAWRSSRGPGVTGILHVGFWRPGTDEFEAVASQWPGKLLFTSAAVPALPPPVEAVYLPCSVQGLRMAVATVGWGYELTNSEASILSRSASLTDRGTEEAGRSSENLLDETADWFASLQRSNTSLAESARQYGIVDERSYIASEATLPKRLRLRLGLARYSLLSGVHLEVDSVLSNLKFAPPWVLATPIAALGLSVRSANRMRERDIAQIRDLAKYSEWEILSFQNLGRKSVREIAERVRDVFLSGSYSVYEHPAPKADLPASQERPCHVVADSSRVSPAVTCFETAIEFALNLLPEHGRRVVRWRAIGEQGRALTLAEIGERLNVTRERVRQIEVKSVSKMSGLPFWKSEVERRLAHILEDRRDPLPLHGLAILDPWFANAEKTPSLLEFILDRLCGARYSLLRIGTDLLVSKLSAADWDKAVANARQILAAEAGRGRQESDLRRTLADLLIGPGEELRELLWQEASKLANFTKAPLASGSRVLASYGHSAERIVEAVLTDADQPLHFRDIAERSATIFERPMDIRRAHAAAASVGLLFGRGIYGLEHHLPLSPSEASMVRAEAEDVIEGGDADRQWHASELFEALTDRGIDLGGRLDPYVLAIALRPSTELTYLGRMVWRLQHPGAQSAGKRIDVQQAIIALLADSGHPLHTDELRRRIAQDRGLGGYFQIQPGGPLVRVGPGVWGLVPRDVPLSEAQVERVVSAIVENLSTNLVGLHASEVHEVLSRQNLAVAEVDPTLIVALAQRSGRVLVGRGQYLYLPNWTGPRRLTARDAVRTALTEGGPDGLTLEEGLKAVEVLLGRRLSRMTFNSLAAGVGHYDKDRQRWMLDENVTEDEGVAPADDFQARD